MSAAATDYDPSTVVVSREAAGSPFAGITLGQARLLNSALCGLPVEVYGGKFTKGPEVYIFERLLLPGTWASDPIAAVGDLYLTHAERVADCYLPRSGLARILSASLVRRFDVLAGIRPWRRCDTCGAVLPRTAKVWDVACISNELLPDGDFEWAHRFECDPCWRSG